MIHRFFNAKRIIQSLLLSLVTLGIGGVITYAAPTPSVISYQGFLTSATGTAQTGTTTVTIRIYDAVTGGVLLYEELHPTTSITNGFFAIQIGSVGDVNGGTTATSITDLSFESATTTLQNDEIGSDEVEDLPVTHESESDSGVVQMEVLTPPIVVE